MDANHDDGESSRGSSSAAAAKPSLVVDVVGTSSTVDLPEGDSVERTEHVAINGTGTSTTCSSNPNNEDDDDDDGSTGQAPSPWVEAAAAVENGPKVRSLETTITSNKTDDETATTASPDTTSSASAAMIMDLNVAYEALEHVRQANVMIEFGREVGPKECIPCLRDSVRLRDQTTCSNNTPAQEAPPQSRFRQFLANARQKQTNFVTRPGPATPCLACATPVCPRYHQYQLLKRENITICVDCSTFFSLEEGNNNDKTKEEKKASMNHMLDVYDRALLVLQYSSQFIDDIASALERNTKRNNQIGLGSSATGIVSGIAGVAAAATIFTPVGPPLLIASILFGGGATAASASSEAVNYRCEANKMADTIYALYGMVHSISRLAKRDDQTALLNNNDNTNENGDNNNNNNNLEGSACTCKQNGPKKQNCSSPQHTTATPASASTATINDDLEARRASTRNWTRATANALKPLTAGALSAASVVMEAREMRATLDKIKAGNPCAKAKSLRKIGAEIQTLPSTTVIAQACPNYFQLDFI